MRELPPQTATRTRSLQEELETRLARLSKVRLDDYSITNRLSQGGSEVPSAGPTIRERIGLPPIETASKEKS